MRWLVSRTKNITSNETQFRSTDREQRVFDPEAQQGKGDQQPALQVRDLSLMHKVRTMIKTRKNLRL
jgi:hypothetical protein